MRRVGKRGRCDFYRVRREQEPTLAESPTEEGKGREAVLTSSLAEKKVLPIVAPTLRSA